VDAFGGFTAASGHNFYTARAFPKKYWNSIAFVSEPTGHILHQNNMQKKGTDFYDKESFNLMAGADEWFSPVFSEVGPDGAVWVADWYSYIIQHNPTPKGFDNGPGNAYLTDLRDFTHGRIYRVSYKEAPEYKPLSLSLSDAKGLLAALKNNNMFWRMHAQRMLVERGQKDVVADLIALVNDKSVDEIGINAPAIHALWTLKGLNALDEATIAAALSHPCADVRKNAIKVMDFSAASVATILKNNVLQDKDPLVVMNALLLFSQSPLDAAAEQAFFARMNKSNEVEDRWMPDAFACVLTANNGKLMKKHLQNQIKASNSKKTAMPAMDHSMHQMGGAKAAPVVKVDGIDLVVADIKIDPATPAVRERINITVEVKNQGTVDLEKENFVPLDIRFEGMGIKVDQISRNFKEGIKAGETVSITKNLNGPWVGNISVGTDVVGDYNLTVAIDKANEVKESNKNNNAFTKKISFSRPADMNAFALESALKSYANKAPADSLVSILKSIQAMEPQSKNGIVKAMAEGWNYRLKDIKLTEANKQFLASVNSGNSNERLSRLMTAWGIATEGQSNADVLRIKISTIKEAMKFSLKEFTVKPGQLVEIVFENPDAMQHNMVFTKPGMLEKVGRAGDAMMKDTKGADKNYVPAIAEVLFSTPLVNPGQNVTLKFKAPSTAADYPFVCTFPGHWSIMNGVMKVRN
jgi:azurin